MSTLPHTPGYSRRSHEIAPFHVMSLLARAQALEQAGHDVIHLEIGEPDFTTAEPVVRAGQAALAAGHTRYTAARGVRSLFPKRDLTPIAAKRQPCGSSWAMPTGVPWIDEYPAPHAGLQPAQP
ncbi:unnamed protein product [Stenotrophomonas maltophilia]|nr:unnamed protein product [Stenotrophomonas maltophilia]